MNSSNAPFCNLYNRKCDFSPLRAAWGPDFFVMGSRAVPLRFDALTGSRLASRISGVCCRALRCVPVSRCNAGGSACLLACHAAALVCAVPGRRSGASVRLIFWPRNFGRDLPRLPYAGVFGWRRGQAVHVDNFDGFDQALVARHGSTDAAR